MRWVGRFLGFFPRTLFVPSSLVRGVGPPEIAGAAVTLALAVPSAVALWLPAVPVWDRVVFQRVGASGAAVAVLALVVYVLGREHALTLPPGGSRVLVAVSAASAPFCLNGLAHLFLLPFSDPRMQLLGRIALSLLALARALTAPLLLAWSGAILWRFLGRWWGRPWRALGAVALGGGASLIAFAVGYVVTWHISRPREPGVLEYQQAFALRWPPSRGEPTLRVRAPLPAHTLRQVPISLQVSALPPECLRAVRLLKLEAPNAVAEMEIGRPGASGWVTVRLKCHVLLAPPAGGARVLETQPPLEPEKPAEVWLRSTYNCQSDAWEMQAAAQGLGAAGRPVGEVVYQVSQFLRKTRGSRGPTALDAVTALKHNISCTTAANLATAVLRARGIPGRQVRVCSTRGLPQQGHWVAEYFGPGLGWVAIEPFNGERLDDPYQYLVLGLVYPAYEDNWSPRSLQLVRGISRWSLIEPEDAVAFTLLTVTPYSNCGERAFFVRSWHADDPRWPRALAASQEWHAHLDKAIAEGRMGEAAERIAPALGAGSLNDYVRGVSKALLAEK